MASVAMKGNTLNFVITSPLKSPTAVPARSAAKMPAAIPWSRIANAPMTLASATVEPTERSRPAVRMVKVCPNDTAARAAAATPILRKFGIEKNTSEAVAKNAISAVTTRGRPSWRPC